MILLNIFQNPLPPREDFTSNPWILGIVSGIIASLISTALIWFILTFWKATIIPFYSKTLYKGLNIEGRWKNEIKNGDKIITKAEMNLKQFGHSLEGVMRLVIYRENEESSFSYKLTGEIINNYINLNATPNDNKNLTFSSGIFEIKNNGKALVGCSVFIDNFTSQVSSHMISWIYWPNT